MDRIRVRVRVQVRVRVSALSRLGSAPVMASQYAVRTVRPGVGRYARGGYVYVYVYSYHRGRELPCASGTGSEQ